MQTIQTVEDLRAWVREQKAAGRTIGLVPTMGALHAGHLSLVRRAKAENDRVVVSIFVNPLQFGPGEDYTVYPRDLARDSELAAGAGADLIFAPSVDTMYPAGFCSAVTVEGLTAPLCGRSRPTHFRGVTTVVARLFNLVQPARAYFGQKDAQQAIVIRRMVRDLAFDLAVVVCPIVREPDGLAMSSRNAFLSPAERRSALVLSRSLFRAQALIAGGERSPDQVLGLLRREIGAEPLVQVDYIEILDGDSLTPVEKLRGKVLIAVAAWVGRTRLIDNVMLELDGDRPGV